MNFDQIKELGVSLCDRLVLHNNPPGWNWRAKLPNYYNLWIALSGPASMWINGKVVPISAGTAVLLFPGDEIYAERHDTSGMRNIGLHFTITQEAEATGLLERFRNRPTELRRLSLVHEMARYLAEIPRSQNVEASDWAAKIFLIFARDWQLGPEDPRDQIIRIQVERIKERPYECAPTETLAKEAGLSLSQYRRRFTKLTNTQPRTFSILQRLETAKRLLLESTLNIDQIAQALGFRDTPFFSRQFKQKTGVSPSDFRSRSRTGSI
ncbi:helix-turn-helix transcriptional regulator [Pelagicoccus sp. SDUM812002]|uniref:helix-turn-helix transcriptional regulator n=1 Tax=Pelagicoccus sp. SDUM812002 TaxID=3041266 RepID=UPI00280F505C|nr:helix-turn-helix transcriptional regulator [Pelagicoccus sp. SDUM812002]MDQ8188381.1 helix-turn-helix transcriptional regulator [Pelagicoccus sp. SDUM812002]